MKNPSKSTHLPLRIGLTGGIASGKSTVAREFAKLGVPVIDTDVLAREAVAPGQPALQALVKEFGEKILDPNGELDRARMRERIFRDPSAKRTLESILHPAIRERQQTLSAKLGGPYQIHVVPLLIETASQDRYDRILVVDCPREIQLARLISRDGISPELASKMVGAQATREARLAAADDVIENASGPADLASQVATLHARYLRAAEAIGDRPI